MYACTVPALLSKRRGAGIGEKQWCSLKFGLKGGMKAMVQLQADSLAFDDGYVVRSQGYCKAAQNRQLCIA